MLAHPSFGVQKTYIAKVTGKVTPQVLEKLTAGIDLEDGPISADKARLLAASVREALPVLNLPTDAQDLLAQIEQNHDPSRAQRATARLYELLSDAASGGLGGVLTMLAAGALGIGP